MKRFVEHRREFLFSAMAFAVSLGVVGCAGSAGPSNDELSSQEGAVSGKPITDTHIHIFQPSRPGGIPWPPVGHPLYRDTLPAEYQAMAAPLGIAQSGIVEASPLNSDTQWVLDQIGGNAFFPFYVAQLEVGSADFVTNLAAIARDKRVVGIRGFLWSPTLTLDAKQVSDLKELARRGMTLDIISRGTLNPKPMVIALADAVPNLRIIIDHLAGAKTATPDPQWVIDMGNLAARPNIYIKMSAFFDMFNATGDESQPWVAPKDVESYRAHFDVLMNTFGEDRLIWGSNWPVCTLAGTVAEEIAIAEGYLSGFSKKVRDKVMYTNAKNFYRRQ